MTWIWWAPLVAALLHIFEEFGYPGGFAAWDRDYRPGIRASITPGLHVLMNGLLVFACLSVGLTVPWRGATAAWSYDRGVALWLTLTALLASNAIFHLLGVIRLRRYSPGVATGMLLYVPLAIFGFWHFLSVGDASAGTAMSAALIGGSYHFAMAVVHARRARPSGM